MKCWGIHTRWRGGGDLSWGERVEGQEGGAGVVASTMENAPQSYALQSQTVSGWEDNKDSPIGLGDGPLKWVRVWGCAFGGRGKGLP